MEYKQLYLCRKCQSWYGMNPEESLKGCPDCKAELEYVPVDYAAYTSMPETNQRAFWSKYLSEPRKGTDVCQELTERRSGIEAKTSADGTSERETDSEMNTRKTIGAIICLPVGLRFSGLLGLDKLIRIFCSWYKKQESISNCRLMLLFMKQREYLRCSLQSVWAFLRFS